MSYQPGTHVIATLQSSNHSILANYASFQSMIDALIAEFGLNKLGEVYHDFLPAGYTGVVCLSESHLSVHTWPEHGKINVDIYLSNYLRNNDGTVNRIYEAVKTLFNAQVIQEQMIRR